jgi:hypothetical protein
LPQLAPVRAGAAAAGVRAAADVVVRTVDELDGAIAVREPVVGIAVGDIVGIAVGDDVGGHDAGDELRLDGTARPPAQPATASTRRIAAPCLLRCTAPASSPATAAGVPPSYVLKVRTAG